MALRLPGNRPANNNQQLRLPLSNVSRCPSKMLSRANGSCLGLRPATGRCLACWTSCPQSSHYRPAAVLDQHSASARSSPVRPRTLAKSPTSRSTLTQGRQAPRPDHKGSLSTAALRALRSFLAGVPLSTTCRLRRSVLRGCACGASARIRQVLRTGLIRLRLVSYGRDCWRNTPPQRHT